MRENGKGENRCSRAMDRQTVCAALAFGKQYSFSDCKEIFLLLGNTGSNHFLLKLSNA